MNMEKAYIEMQKAWVEEYGVKKGTRVKVVREVPGLYMGWANSWESSMQTDEVLVVESVSFGGGIKLSNMFFYPIFSLEVLPDEPEPKPKPKTLTEPQAYQHMFRGGKVRGWNDDVYSLVHGVLFQDGKRDPEQRLPSSPFVTVGAVVGAAPNI